VGHDFDTTILKRVSHRPWPLAETPWVMTQTWHDLLFAHWRIDRSVLRSKVPPPFELDLFDGEAWIGIVPFRMTNVGPRGVPSLPWVSEFPELNVRTYVRVGDRPGVYFFSLDAGSAIAVRAARLLLNLPYHAALMNVTAKGSDIAYESRRVNNAQAELRADYRPVGTAFEPVEGSLEYFLTERYCLYHVTRHGTAYRLEIHHPLWRLHHAEAEIVRNGMAAASDLTLDDAAPLLHFVKRQDMVAWAPTRLGQDVKQVIAR
jgi:hypothetical protein